MAQMSAIEFVGSLALLRWSASEVAIWCGYSRQSGTYWQTGRHRIPQQVADWLDARLNGQLVDPPGRPKA